MTTVRGLEFVEARVHALRLKAVAALHAELRRAAASPAEAGGTASTTAAEVAAALNVSQRTGRALVEEALMLTDPGLAPVLDAMEDGRIDRRRARAVMEQACVLPAGKDADFCAAAVDLACPDDGGRAPSPGAFARRLRRLAEEYHDEPLASRKDLAASFRRVEVEPAKDGMCWITAHLPVEVGAAIDTRLEALARSLQGEGEARGIGQLRADVFRDLLVGAQLPRDSARKPGARAARPEFENGNSCTGELHVAGVRTEVVVTVPARTLSGEAETPGEILGYGPVDAPAARLLAAEAATWTTMYVDPGSGAPLALGRKRYAPSLAIRRFLGARDKTCRFPGCDKPASATEADHTEEWHQGGVTDVANLALLCREHHRLKSLGIWKLRQVGREEPMGTERPPDAVTGSESDSGDPPAREAPACEAPREVPDREVPACDVPDREVRAREVPACEVPDREVPACEVPARVTPYESAAPTGVLEWISPTGRRYVTYPESDAPPPF